jgi:hypothetical protein
MKQKHNTQYFPRIPDRDTGTEEIQVNFDGYYKGRTVKQDIDEFFKLSS